MKDPVLIKSSKYGINIRFNESMPYSELLLAVKAKFESAARFFNHADMIVEFDGRTFTKEEEQQMAEAIEDAAQIHIVCMIDKDGHTEKIHKRMLDESKPALQAKDGMFYKGTLRGRQILESETSIVIVGDVEDGAVVISKGNVIVTGTIYGTVTAGAMNDYNAVIAALHMKPKRLKIGDIELKPVIGGSYSWAKLL